MILVPYSVITANEGQSDSLTFVGIVSFLTHIMKKLLQVLLQLKEVDRGDEALTGFGQAVSGQLHYLMVDEAEDSISQWKHVLRRKSLDELSQPVLHLCCGLMENERCGERKA